MQKEKIVADEEGEIHGLMLSVFPDTTISKATTTTTKQQKNPIPHHKSIKKTSFHNIFIILITTAWHFCIGSVKFFLSIACQKEKVP